MGFFSDLANRIFGNDDAVALKFYTNNAERLHIKSTGEVGVGKIPDTTLDVNGVAKATGLIMTTSPGTGKLLQSDATGSSSWATVPSAKSIFTFGARSIPINTTHFMFPQGIDDNNGAIDNNNSADDYAVRIPFACTIKNLYVRQNTAGSGGSHAYKLYKNGTATGLTVSVNSADAEGADTTNTVSIAAGDRISMEMAGSTVTTSPQRILASIELLIS